MDAQKKTLIDPTPPLVPVDKVRRTVIERHMLLMLSSKSLGKYQVTSCTLGR